jgi:hypothetical protein
MLIILKCDDGVKGASGAAGTVRHRREGRVVGRRIGPRREGGMAWAEGERDRADCVLLSEVLIPKYKVFFIYP